MCKDCVCGQKVTCYGKGCCKEKDLGQELKTSLDELQAVFEDDVDALDELAKKDEENT